MKIHLGAGPKILPGFINCDCRKLPGIDKVFDMEVFPWPFVENSAEYIFTEENLEHLSWRCQTKVFAELYRILKKDGTVSIQVPDIGKMCHNYVNKEVCSCVPHKADSVEGFKADKNCKKCEGKAKVNDTRWLMALAGSQKHPKDSHLCPFTQEYISKLITDSKLHIVKFEDHPYKLKVLAKK